jgi:hypothetical protein
MPTHCVHFGHLQSRVNDLVEIFLADQISQETDDPTGYLPNPDRIAAFRLLVHAEFEEFIEKKAGEGLRSLALNGNASSFQIRNMHHLLAISQLFAFDLGLAPPFDQSQYIDKAKLLLKRAEKEVSENNGIKPGSFLKLCLFFGAMPDEVDQTLLSTLESYGKARGDVAHRSISRVSTIYAPSVEKENAQTIVRLLQGFYDVHS